MKKVILGLGGGVLVLVAALVAVVAMQPSQTTIVRSQTIAAEPDDLWPYIADMHLVQEWSPWNAKDPDMEKTYSEASAGVGASYAWSGNEDVGSGSSTITAVEEGVSVTSALEFITPYPGTAVDTLALSEADDGTTVTWSLTTDNNFMSKAAGLFMDG